MYFVVILQYKCNNDSLDLDSHHEHHIFLVDVLGGFSICRCSSVVEHILETDKIEVRFLSTAHALVAQRTEQSASIGKVGGSIPSEGTTNCPE